MSRDPWEGTGWRPATLNYYVYAGDNPANRADPTGHRECEPQSDGTCLPLSELACPLGSTTITRPPLQPPGIKQHTWDTYIGLWQRLAQENSPYLLSDGRLDDRYLVATLIKIETESALAEGTGTVYGAALEAISYHYRHFDCRGDCTSLQQQLQWMDGMQNWWDRRGRPLPVIPGNCSHCWNDSSLAMAGYQDSQPAQSYWWGNPLRGSDLATYIHDNYPALSYRPYALMVDNNRFIVGFRGTEVGGPGGILDFVVVTKQQNDSCGGTCMGFSWP
jgi:hypothetical protein